MSASQRQANFKRTAEPDVPSLSRKRSGINSRHISSRRRNTCMNDSRPPTKGGYISAGMANNAMETTMAFANLAQSTAEDRATITNLKTVNSTLPEQVVRYANRLSTKEADNVLLQKAMKNLQGEVKKLKAEVTTLKGSGHNDGTSATKHNRGRPEPKWKRELQDHHPTWKITQ